MGPEGDHEKGQGEYEPVSGGGVGPDAVGVAGCGPVVVDRYVAAPACAGPSAPLNFRTRPEVFPEARM